MGSANPVDRTVLLELDRETRWRRSRSVIRRAVTNNRCCTPCAAATRAFGPVALAEHRRPPVDPGVPIDPSAPAQPDGRDASRCRGWCSITDGIGSIPGRIALWSTVGGRPMCATGCTFRRRAAPHSRRGRPGGIVDDRRRRRRYRRSTRSAARCARAGCRDRPARGTAGPRRPPAGSYRVCRRARWSGEHGCVHAPCPRVCAA